MQIIQQLENTEQYILLF